MFQLSLSVRGKVLLLLAFPQSSRRAVGRVVCPALAATDQQAVDLPEFGVEQDDTALSAGVIDRVLAGGRAFMTWPVVGISTSGSAMRGTLFLREIMSQRLPLQAGARRVSQSPTPLAMPLSVDDAEHRAPNRNG